MDGLGGNGERMDIQGSDQKIFATIHSMYSPNALYECLGSAINCR